jgi:hypothetical protein
MPAGRRQRCCALSRTSARPPAARPRLHHPLRRTKGVMSDLFADAHHNPRGSAVPRLPAGRAHPMGVSAISAGRRTRRAGPHAVASIAGDHSLSFSAANSGPSPLAGWSISNLAVRASESQRRGARSAHDPAGEPTDRCRGHPRGDRRKRDDAPQARLRLTIGTSFAIASSVVITSPKNSRKLFSVAACSSSVQVALASDSMVTR